MSIDEWIDQTLAARLHQARAPRKLHPRYRCWCYQVQQVDEEAGLVSCRQTSGPAGKMTEFAVG